MVVVNLLYLSNKLLSSKLSKGTGHNYYGEPAWPNDILYMFPIVILGWWIMVLGLALYEPYNTSEQANAFSTPLEILPEWYFLTSFNMLRILSSKLIGVLSMLYLPRGVVLIPFGENINRYQNPFRRSAMISIFLTMSYLALWLTIGALEPILKAIALL